MNHFTRLSDLYGPSALGLIFLLLGCACAHQDKVKPSILDHSTNLHCPTTSLEVKESRQDASVVRVIDGDTIALNDGLKIRLIGVDTPESVHPKKAVEHFSVEASAFTKRHIEGKTVILVFDQSNSATKHRDRYGRILAYVYRKDDGFDLNAELIKQGYAHAYTKYPIERLEEFRCYEKEAREAGRGLWK